MHCNKLIGASIWFCKHSKGTHINAVGAHGQTKRELPTELIQSAKVYVDSLSSSQVEAGNLLIPIEQDEYEWNLVEGEIGSFIESNTKISDHESNITVFSSVGSAVQDLVIAVMVMESGKEWKHKEQYYCWMMAEFLGESRLAI